MEIDEVAGHMNGCYLSLAALKNSVTSGEAFQQKDRVIRPITFCDEIGTCAESAFGTSGGEECCTLLARRSCSRTSR